MRKKQWNFSAAAARRARKHITQRKRKNNKQLSEVAPFPGALALRLMAISMESG